MTSIKLFFSKYYNIIYDKLFPKQTTVIAPAPVKKEMLTVVEL